MTLSTKIEQLEMPDRTKCENKECPLSNECWRFNMPSNTPHQHFQKFEPVIEEGKEVKCEFYIAPPKK